MDKDLGFLARINQLIEPFHDLYSSKEECDRLTEKIKDTRNYLTHYNPSKKEKSAQGEEMWIIAMKLESLFQLNFLKLLNFNPEQITKIAASYNSLKRKIESNLP